MSTADEFPLSTSNVHKGQSTFKTDFFLKVILDQINNTSRLAVSVLSLTLHIFVSCNSSNIKSILTIITVNFLSLLSLMPLMNSAKSLPLLLIVFSRIRAADLPKEYYSKLHGTDESNSCREINATKSLVYRNKRSVIHCALACQSHPWCASFRFSRNKEESNQCKLFNDFPGSYDICTSYFKEPSMNFSVSYYI